MNHKDREMLWLAAREAGHDHARRCTVRDLVAGGRCLNCGFDPTALDSLEEESDMERDRR